MAWNQRITIQKDLHDPDNHDSVITYLEPDILEWEVKWAYGSITTKKASGGDGVPVELFQILKMMLFKCCIQYVSKFTKLSSGHKTRKGHFSFQSQRRAMPKNDQTTTQLHSSHILAKKCPIFPVKDISSSNKELYFLLFILYTFNFLSLLIPLYRTPVQLSRESRHCCLICGLCSKESSQQ